MNAIRRLFCGGRPCRDTWGGGHVAAVESYRPPEGCGGRPRSLLTEAQWDSVAGALGLSQRELQIIQCIFDGEKEAGIARALDISAHTVHTHVERLYRKLGIGGRSELAIRVFAAYISLESGRGVDSRES